MSTLHYWTRTGIWSLALVFMLTFSLHAATVTWDGSESGDWSDGSNWVGGTAPVSNDVVVLTSGTFAPTNMDLIGGYFSRIDVDSTNLVSFTLSGNPFSVGDFYFSSNPAATQDYTLLPDITMTADSTWYVQSRVNMYFNGSISESGLSWALEANGNGNIYFYGTNTFSGGIHYNQVYAHFYGIDTLGTMPTAFDEDYFTTGSGIWIFESPDSNYYKYTLSTNAGFQTTSGSGQWDDGAWLRVGEDVKVVINTPPQRERGQ